LSNQVSNNLLYLLWRSLLLQLSLDRRGVNSLRRHRFLTRPSFLSCVAFLSPSFGTVHKFLSFFLSPGIIDLLPYQDTQTKPTVGNFHLIDEVDISA
jgi:hypothetical protein